MNFLNQEAEESPYMAMQHNGQTCENDSVMAKIARFIDARHIPIDTFWQSDRNCASAADIITFCKSCGLNLPEYDVINLKSQIFTNKETIYIDQFAANVSFWEAHEKDTVGDFMKKRSDMLLDKLQAKERKRPKSGFPDKSASTDSFKRTLTRQASAHRPKREESRPTLVKNNSKEYLRKYKDRQNSREKELHGSIEKNKIDQEYGMLLKMSELNTINKERENKTTYRAYKSAEGIVKVRVFNFNKFEKEISLNEFDTIYKNFKKTIKKNKDWTVVHQGHSQKGTDQLQLLKNRNTQKSERQQQLKNLLVGTVNLTNLLKEQIKIFKEKGILGSEHL